jgi:MFS family permease
MARWGICIFLLFATCLSYLDRQALSVVAPVIRAELSLDNAQLGLLLSAFFYSYSLMHLVVGWILDRFPIRPTYALFVVFWSFSQAAAGFAQGFASLFGARVGLGAFEAAAQPGAARIIAANMEQKDRSLANGLMMSGGSIGAIIAAPLMIGLTNVVGWRSGFLILGAAGLAWAVLWMLWSPQAAARPLPALRAGGRILGPKFWSCAAGALLTIPIIHISSSWIPTYFVQEWKLPLAAGLGAYLFFIYLGLDFGFLGGGAAVSLLIRRGCSVARARKIVMTASSAVMLAAALVPFAPSVGTAVFLVFLLNLGRAAWGANFLAFNQDIAPGRVGLMAGVMGAIGAFSGALLVWLIGILSKQSGFRLPFLLVAALAALGLIPILLVNWDESSADTR